MTESSQRGGVLSLLFGRNMPAYTWVGVIYALVVAFVMIFPPTNDAPAPTPAAEATVEAGAPAVATEIEAPVESSVAKNVESRLVSTLFVLPLMSGDGLPITLSIIITVMCLVAGWIEVIRVTNIRAHGGNDIMSLLVTIVALVLFIAVPSFGTSAFLIVVVTGVGDLLLDRIVGQAVARRDIGFPGMS